jgi:methylglutamate dehydrogenase subunit B
MLIACPYCGARDAQEFSYRGDASPVRPDPSAPDALEKFHDYVYLRDNPAGAHRELWYHGAGCRRWIEVARDTLTHAIAATRFRDDGRRA